jgi:hypothetical protein
VKPGAAAKISRHPLSEADHPCDASPGAIKDQVIELSQTVEIEGQRRSLIDMMSSSVKNSQAIDLESGNGGLRQSNLPETGDTDWDSLQI